MRTSEAEGISLLSFRATAERNPKHKTQVLEKSRNRNTKNQAPNTKEIPSSKLQTAARASSLELLWSLVFGVWCLEPGASLELGVWNLELTAWALSFSEIETCPVIIGVRIILRYSAFAA